VSHLPADTHRRLEARIDTGDHVRHSPSDEEWVVAYVQGDRLAWCGWPSGLAALADCTLTRKASPAERLSLLRDMAAMNGSDHRASYARQQLAAEGIDWVHESSPNG